MLLAGLVLLTLLTSSDGLKSGTEDCDDCNENGPWWPLFKPSQIIKSEFPEHRRQWKSAETSGSYEHTLPSSSEGQVEWDHYADVSKVRTVANNSVESVELPQRNYRSGEEEAEEERTPKTSWSLEDVSLTSDEGSLGSFFDKMSFSPSRDRLGNDFDLKDFSFSKEDSSNSIEFPRASVRNAFGRQNNQVATSYASFSSVFAKPRAVNLQARDLLHPAVNSEVPNYVVGEQRTPLSHSKFTFNGLNVTGHASVHQQQDRQDQGFGQKINDNRGLLWNTHGSSLKPISRRNQLIPGSPLQNHLAPYVPSDHPVYRYVKHHGGLPGQIKPGSSHHRLLEARNSSLGNVSLQREPAELPVQVHFQNHETVIRHVVPTKSPFAETFWKESRRIESFQPPPPPPPPPPSSAKHTVYIIKKKTNDFGLRRIGRTAPHHVYILRDTNRIRD